MASKSPYGLTENESEDSFIADGNLQFVHEKGGNGALPSYQEASGAPVEEQSPLGYHANFWTLVFLNIGQMVGTGVFSTPSTILGSLGSVGLSLIYWFIGFVISSCAQTVFLELASYFPSRSGGEVVYLEQAYPRPKYFFPTAFAVQNVILSFSSSNTIVLAEYLFRVGNREPSDWQLKGVAVASYSLAILCIIFNTKISYHVANGITFVKVLTLIFISITGLVVLGGNTRVQNPTANFQDAFAGTTKDAYSVTNALVKIHYAYQGYNNVFKVVNEIKNPISTLKKSAPLSLLMVAILYMLCNIAYFAAVPIDTLKEGTVTAAGLFFEAVFGSGGAARGLNFLIVLSAFGNLITVLIGDSRMIRECGRQGVLPWTNFWVSTRPFGTPLGPYFLKWSLTVIMIVAPPAGDAFNFAVDLQSYPHAAFYFAMAVGLLLIRHQRKKINAPRAEFRAWVPAVVIFILSNLFLLVMPWYPPAEGRFGGTVSFWYGTYVVVGISIILACAIYYVLWIYVIPHFKHYRIRQEHIILDNGAASHRLIKVPLDEIEEWDKKHDVSGRLRSAPAPTPGNEDKEA